MCTHRFHTGFFTTPHNYESKTKIPKQHRSIATTMMSHLFCSYNGRDLKNKKRCSSYKWKDGFCESHYTMMLNNRNKRSAQDKARYLLLSEANRIHQTEHNELIQLRQRIQDLEQTHPKVNSSVWIRDSVRHQQEFLCRGPGGNPYNATTTLEKMRADGFDFHARLKATGWIIIQGAFDPTKVDCIGIMDRVAVLGEGLFDEITNEDIDASNRSSQRKQIPAPTNSATDGILEKNVNSRAREIVDDAVR